MGKYGEWTNFETWLTYSHLVNTPDIMIMLTSPFSSVRDDHGAMVLRIQSVVNDWRMLQVKGSGLWADIAKNATDERIDYNVLATEILKIKEK